MAYGYTLEEVGVMGNMKYEIYAVDDIQDDSSSTITTGMKNPKIALPMIEKVTGDTVNVVSISGQTITLDASTSDDDCMLLVLGK